MREKERKKQMKEGQAHRELDSLLLVLTLVTLVMSSLLLLLSFVIFLKIHIIVSMSMSVCHPPSTQE